MYTAALSNRVFLRFSGYGKLVENLKKYEIFKQNMKFCDGLIILWLLEQTESFFFNKSPEKENPLGY